MADDKSESYENISVFGPIRGELVAEIAEWGYIVLILGPTGAGKSTFIEAIAQDSSLQISSCQLDGFTQTISMYRLYNVENKGGPIYLVDVPGFADMKISQMGIILMLKEWMTSQGVRAFSRIMYFTPVNVVRLPGSHRQVLRTFQSLIGVENASNITIVSTMWDCICNDGVMKRAEQNFRQLQNDIWQDLIREGSQLVKYHNTQDSALSVLDRTMVGETGAYFPLERFGNGDQNILETPFCSLVYADLQNRIQNLEIQRFNIQLEMEQIVTGADEELMAVLIHELEEVDKSRAHFERELRNFVPPPTEMRAHSAVKSALARLITRMIQSMKRWRKGGRKHLDA